MKIISSISQLRNTLAPYRKKGKSIGFVPTMGALHEGHASLLRRCKKENSVSVLSIFVNPTQFGPDEDLKEYPRDKKKDVLLAKKEKVDIIFYPSEKTIYPAGYLTYVDVGQLGHVLEGRSRPGHFRGVATVVTKLLNMVGPDRLYLGAKDAQQCIVIQRVVQDLNLPVSVVVCPTVREADGLAMSSRNQYLTAAQRKEAAILYQALNQAKSEIQKGFRDATRIRYLIEQTIRTQSAGDIDYVACVDAGTLEPLNILKDTALLAVAVRWGRTRLIDNMTVKI